VKEATMYRSWICFVIVVVLAAVFAGRLTSARATDTGCSQTLCDDFCNLDLGCTRDNAPHTAEG